MARKPNPGHPIETLLTEIAGHLDGSSTALVRRFAGTTADRARRIESARARIAEHLGDDHPRVARLQRRATLADAVATGLDETQRQVADTDPLRPHERLAHGRVVLADGTPLTGLRVRVYDRDDHEDDLLGDELTDQEGTFRAIYHQRDFDHEGGRLPDLHVTVTDRSDNLVFASDRTVPASPDRSDFFQIVLTGERLTKGVPRTRCEATTAKRTQCRNLAEPGGRLCGIHAEVG